MDHVIVITPAKLEELIDLAVEKALLKHLPAETLPVPEKRFFTRKEVAEMLNVSLVTLNDWNRAGILPCFRLGSRVRYRWEDIQKSVSDHLKRQK